MIKFWFNSDHAFGLCFLRTFPLEYAYDESHAWVKMEVMKLTFTIATKDH